MHTLMPQINRLLHLWLSECLARDNLVVFHPEPVTNLAALLVLSIQLHGIDKGYISKWGLGLGHKGG